MQELPKLIALSLATAMLAAPLIRATTAELNQSLGTHFPFSLAHCRVSATPGCDPAPPFAGQLATR